MTLRFCVLVLYHLCFVRERTWPAFPKTAGMGFGGEIGRETAMGT